MPAGRIATKLQTSYLASMVQLGEGETMETMR